MSPQTRIPPSCGPGTMDIEWRQVGEMVNLPRLLSAPADDLRNIGGRHWPVWSVCARAWDAGWLVMGLSYKSGDVAGSNGRTSMYCAKRWKSSVLWVSNRRI